MNVEHRTVRNRDAEHRRENHRRMSKDHAEHEAHKGSPKLSIAYAIQIRRPEPKFESLRERGNSQNATPNMSCVIHPTVKKCNWGSQSPTPTPADWTDAHETYGKCQNEVQEGRPYQPACFRRHKRFNIRQSRAPTRIPASSIRGKHLFAPRSALC